MSQFTGSAPGAHMYNGLFFFDAKSGALVYATSQVAEEGNLVQLSGQAEDLGGKKSYRIVNVAFPMEADGDVLVVQQELAAQ